jgi:hypothetical protein
VNAGLSVAQASRVFYVLTVTRWFPVGLIVGILVLLATSRGLSAAQALSYAAVSGLVTFALELPTGGLADVLGRRPVYLLAASVNVVAAIAYVLAHTFWEFVAAATLMGIFRALDSGPLEAWFVDAVHRQKPGADVDQELSRSGTLLGLSMAAGAVVSGALIWWHPLSSSPPLDLVVWLFLAGNVLHLAAAAILLQEPPRRQALGSVRNTVAVSIRRVPAVIGSGLRLALANGVLAGILGAEICWSVAMLAFESLLPLRLEELLGSGQRAGAVVGPVAALGWALFAVGTWLAGLVSRRSVAGAAMLGRGLNGVGVLLMAAAAGPVGLVTAYLFTYSMHGLNGPPHGALLHREASSSNRTTVLSMNSMVASLAFGVASPIVGLLAERTSIAAAMAVVGVVGLVGVVGYLPARRTEGHPLR